MFILLTIFVFVSSEPPEIFYNHGFDTVTELLTPYLSADDELAKLVYKYVLQPFISTWHVDDHDSQSSDSDLHHSDSDSDLDFDSDSSHDKDILALNTTNYEIRSHPMSIKLPLTKDGRFDFVVLWGDGEENVITSFDQPEVKHTYARPGVYEVHITGIVDGFGFSPVLNETAHESCQEIYDISQWGCVNLANKSGYQFYECIHLNVSALDVPDLRGVTNMEGMFFNACSFNGDVSLWDTSVVTNMEGMFCNASSFSGDVSQFNTDLVTDMGYMFYGASLFNSDLNNWNTSCVTNMEAMFANASRFNGDLSTWNTKLVTNMKDMFWEAVTFTGDLSRWNTSSVINMKSMFWGACQFNSDLSGWCTELVNNMEGMFTNASNFNGNLSEWKTNNVTFMDSMFYGASRFNSNLNSWNTSSVTQMSLIFVGATSFDPGNITAWDFTHISPEDKAEIFG